MQEYNSKQAFIDEIKKTANLFIHEFEDVSNADKDVRYNEVDRTPQEIIAYQLGWMGLLRSWDRDELEGKPVFTPAPDYKWNQLGPLYQSFYDKYRNESLKELQNLFINEVESLVEWLNEFEEKEIFQPGGRKWAASTTANWPIWKWVHINTVAPFKSFRTKIRRWKKVNAAQ